MCFFQISICWDVGKNVWKAFFVPLYFYQQFILKISGYAVFFHSYPHLWESTIVQWELLNGIMDTVISTFCNKLKNFNFANNVVKVEATQWDQEKMITVTKQ